MSETTDHPGKQIKIGTVPNFRDLGGWAARGGRVRSGLLFRSAEFENLAGDDLAAFERLGIRSVYDFRTADERNASPNTLPAGTEYIVLDILAGAKGGAAPAELLKLVSDPKAADEALGGGKAAVPGGSGVGLCLAGRGDDLTRGGADRAINVPLARVITGQLRLPAATRTPRSEPVTPMCGQPSKLVMRVRFPPPAPRPLQTEAPGQRRRSSCAPATGTRAYGARMPLTCH